MNNASCDADCHIITSLLHYVPFYFKFLGQTDPVVSKKAICITDSLRQLSYLYYNANEINCSLLSVVDLLQNIDLDSFYQNMANVVSQISNSAIGLLRWTCRLLLLCPSTQNEKSAPMYYITYYKKYFNNMQMRIILQENKQYIYKQTYDLWSSVHGKSTTTTDRRLRWAAGPATSSCRLSWRHWHATNCTTYRTFYICFKSVGKDVIIS